MKISKLSQMGVPLENARECLIRVALVLFAKQGFSKTSIRAIATAAKTNVAAVSYYFGDKAGLYRAVFLECCGPVEASIARFNQVDQPLSEALYGFFSIFLEPLEDGDMARHHLLLHFREMLEPTGLWVSEINERIKPQHLALVELLRRHLKLEAPDDEVHRLALSITGLGVHLYVGSDVTQALVPELNNQAGALRLWADRLVLYAKAMIEAEAQRRSGG
jgi:TetR/AcrR family transcriptional regulator, regulator of cefoperazone and chloramphenicol sensitivity